MRTGGMLANMIIVTTTLGFFMGQAPLRPENAPAFMGSMRLDLYIFAGLNLLAVACSLSRRRSGAGKAEEGGGP
jgi:hypothetical protein